MFDSFEQVLVPFEVIFLLLCDLLLDDLYLFQLVLCTCRVTSLGDFLSLYPHLLDFHRCIHRAIVLVCLLPRPEGSNPISFLLLSSQGPVSCQILVYHRTMQSKVEDDDKCSHLLSARSRTAVISSNRARVSLSRAAAASSSAARVSLSRLLASLSASRLLDSSDCSIAVNRSISCFDTYKKTPFFFEFSLCLSRACLGKMSILSINGAENGVSYP